VHTLCLCNYVVTGSLFLLTYCCWYHHFYWYVTGLLILLLVDCSLGLTSSEKMADEKKKFKFSQVIISVRLNGAENYLLWSRQILMHLKGQRLT
jgi:gag-polypeptide of LTR copia-type